LKIATLPAGLALRIIAAFGFGFFLSMFTRASGNLLNAPIRTDLGVSESTMSLTFGLAFFIAFGLAQLPIGVMLDRYDPRRVCATMLLVAACGTVIFALAHTSGQMAAGRVLMGMGFAACMMSALKTYSLWFPVDKLPTINGVQFAIGILGTISASKPTEWLLQVIDWRGIAFGTAALSVLAAAVLLTLAPRHHGRPSGETLMDQIKGIALVYGDGYFWRATPWAFVSIGISQGVGTLYVVPWLTTAAGLSTPSAANILFVTSAASIVNYLLVGHLIEWMSRRGFGPMTIPYAGIVVSMGMMALIIAFPATLPMLCWVIWSLSIGWASLTVAGLARAFPVALAGRVYTDFNQMSFLVTSLVQMLVGAMLDIFPQSGGVPASGSYRLAFGAVLGLQVLGCLWTVAARVLRLGERTMIERENAMTAQATHV
jgi:predicted MFS family arabinose efflux permease